jgi:hypothetical protein
MHTTRNETPDLDGMIAAVAGMDPAQLGRLAEAVDRRRADLATSRVSERRPYGSGVLQLEVRRNPRTGTERGPYWYFKYREAGRQRTEYVGKDLEGWMELREGRAHA